MRKRYKNNMDDQIMLDAIQASMTPKAVLNKKLKICMTECAEESDSGSIGCFFLIKAAESEGFKIDILPLNSDKTGYDIELFSVHHCSDWERLALKPKRSKIRIIGGHVMANNCRPGIPMSDVVCIGEGETWLKAALNMLEKDLNVNSLADLPGTIISSKWNVDSDIPDANFEKPLPDNPPYLNRPGTLSARWYIEIARGCPFKCAYCELGHSVKYRFYSKESILKKIAMIDTSITRKINFFAPDEASHPNYSDFIEIIKDMKYQQAFGSYRIDQVLKNKIKFYSKGQTIRVGVDGLTEETRIKVNKPITNKMLIEYFSKMCDSGFVNFKIFMIIGYPWEKESDFDEFKNIFDKIFSMNKYGKRKELRIKWTPLIPQPCTPLAGIVALYDRKMIERINFWHKVTAKQYKNWYVKSDGYIMAEQNHTHQIYLTNADEFSFLKTAKYINEKWEKR